MMKGKPAPAPAPAGERGTGVALIFALAAERLSAYYEHGQWLTEAQGATLAADWLSRSKRGLPLDERRRLSARSDGLARRIAATLSREAGLYTAHEMMEALDPNYHSEIAQSLMVECEQLFDGAGETADAPPSPPDASGGSRRCPRYPPDTPEGMTDAPR